MPLRGGNVIACYMAARSMPVLVFSHYFPFHIYFNLIKMFAIFFIRIWFAPHRNAIFFHLISFRLLTAGANIWHLPVPLPYVFFA